MRRGRMLAAVLTLGMLSKVDGSAGQPHGELPTVVIVTSSSVEVFEEAVGGIERGLGSAARILKLDSASKPENLKNQLAARDVRLVVTVGTNALQAAQELSAAPILATMVLKSDLTAARARPPVAAIALDVPLAEVFARLETVFPRKNRAAIIRHPDAADTLSASQLASQAKAAGITLLVIDCPRPELLLQSLRSLKGQIDFVWCPPDATLYNGTTVKPLIMTSLEMQVPVAGFSASFVRAGAVAGVYPDYVDVGLQTGEMARKFLSGANVPSIESPRKTRLASNPRVARLFGLRVPQKSDAASGLVVIE